MRRARSWLLVSLLPAALWLTGCSGCASEVPSVWDDGGPGAAGDAGAHDAGATDAGDVGDAGDGEGAADGGARDAGDLDGGGEIPDAGSDDGGAVEPACVEDSDCALGELCVAGQCAPGCDDDRDCPTGLLCDDDLGPNGSCVACLTNDDCPNAGDVCLEGTCYASCTEATPACPGGLVCDVDLGACVGCVQDSDCSLGEICEDQDCTPGCRQNRDCPEGQICGADNTCREGCVAAPVDSCPLGTHCVAGDCQLGCNDDDSRCGEGQACVSQDGASICRDACADDDDCGGGTICVDGVCAAGCRVDDDCGGFGGGGVCDTTAGTPGTCVQCLVDDDCPGFGIERVCDVVARTCRVPCSATGQIGCIGGVCDVTNDVCVQCLVDDDCDAGESCDPVRRECVAPPAGLCGACQDDADCGGEGSLCVQRGLAPFVTESACGIDCSDASCPQGYACVFVGDPVVRGQQCVPASSVVEAPSCEAIRDLEAGQACGFDAQCGAAPTGDARCFGAAQGQPGQCTIPCGVDADCPATYACEAAPGAPDAPAGICAPLP